MTDTITLRVDAGGQRVDKFLAEHSLLSRSAIQRLARDGHVRVDGASVEPAYKVRAGQELVVDVPEAEPDVLLRAEDIAIDVLYEDEDVVVVNKPAGLVVHPAHGHKTGTLVNAMLGRIESTTGRESGRPGIVHRLDKDTSGLLVVAKTEPVHRALSRDFAGRRIERAYGAFVWGVPVPAAGEISGNIGRSSSNRKKMAVVAATRGKPAVTRYRVERRFGNHAALIECRLLTGRTHQIRVHLAHAGHPLIGDPVYGTRGGRAVARLGPSGAAIAGFPRQALHARLLGFTHPATDEKLTFESPLPMDMEELLTNLELL